MIIWSSNPFTLQRCFPVDTQVINAGECGEKDHAFLIATEGRIYKDQHNDFPLGSGSGSGSQGGKHVIFTIEYIELEKLVNTARGDGLHLVRLEEPD